MATLNTAKTSSLLVSVLNHLEAANYAAEAAKAELKATRAALEQRAESTTALLVPGEERLELENNIRALSLREKAANAVVRDRFKTAKEVLNLDYEAVKAAAENGNADAKIEIIAKTLSRFYPEGTKWNEIVGFARKVALTLGTKTRVKKAASLATGERMTPVSEKVFVENLLFSLIEELGKNKKSGVTVFNGSDAVVTYNFITEAGKVRFVYNVISLKVAAEAANEKAAENAENATSTESGKGNEKGKKGFNFKRGMPAEAAAAYERAARENAMREAADIDASGADWDCVGYVEFEVATVDSNK